MGDGYGHEECGDITRKATETPKSLPFPPPLSPSIQDVQHLSRTLMSSPNIVPASLSGFVSTLAEAYKRTGQVRCSLPQAATIGTGAVVRASAVIGMGVALYAAGAAIVSPTQFHILSPTYIYFSH